MSVDYGVLNRLVFGTRNRRDRTSITVKKTVTESKAAWAGGIRQGSFALFRVWRNAFNVEAAQVQVSYEGGTIELREPCLCVSGG